MCDSIRDRHIGGAQQIIRRHKLRPVQTRDFYWDVQAASQQAPEQCEHNQPGPNTQIHARIRKCFFDNASLNKVGSTLMTSGKKSFMLRQTPEPFNSVDFLDVGFRGCLYLCFIHRLVCLCMCVCVCVCANRYFKSRPRAELFFLA
ncbi:Peroxisomal biogenesis factor 19 [Fusarium oxysporum f. sp. albedinis]|nr:Peroxisomal biogenesis factor 19 [Fusarium oxysporum f. sp. albedinis]